MADRKRGIRGHVSVLLTALVSASFILTAGKPPETVAAETPQAAATRPVTVAQAVAGRLLPDRVAVMREKRDANEIAAIANRAVSREKMPFIGRMPVLSLPVPEAPATDTAADAGATNADANGVRHPVDDPGFLNRPDRGRPEVRLVDPPMGINADAHGVQHPVDDPGYLNRPDRGRPDVRLSDPSPEVLAELSGRRQK